MELVGDLAVFVLAEQHGNKFIANEDLSRVRLLRPCTHFQFSRTKRFAQIRLQPGQFFLIHS